MTITELWDELGVDKKTVLERFVGNVDLAVKFTKKYAEDDTFEKLGDAVKNADYRNIEMTAHTLKGVAGNLGFDDIHNITQKIVDEVRGENYDEIGSDFEALTAEQDKIRSAIGRLD